MSKKEKKLGLYHFLISEKFFFLMSNHFLVKKFSD